MRIDPAGYAVINQKNSRSPRYVVHVEFDTGVDMWLTSHADCAVPSGTAVADVYYNVVSDLSGTSQKIDPIKALSTIGTIGFSVIDTDELITTRINTEYDNLKGLRGKTVEFYIGEEASTWTDYILIQTQIIQNISIKDGVYDVKCADIQRTIRKDIFDIERTTMKAAMSADQTVVPAVDVSSFATVAHGTSYTDLPSETVGYIQIEKEIIAWRFKVDVLIGQQESDVSFSGNTISSTLIDMTQFSDGMQIQVSGSTSNDGNYVINGAPTTNALVVGEALTTESAGQSVTIIADTQFYKCDRGVLNTKAVEHVLADPIPSEDQRTKIEELIYLEMPIPKLIYALLTGIIYGTADVLPTNWHLNISTNFVATSQFVNIGPDKWDITDDDVGLQCRFVAPKKSTGKKFIEEELLLLAGLFTPVLADGQLGLRNMSSVLATTSYVRELNESNVQSISELTHDLEEVQNQFNIEWNYDRDEERFTRSNIFVDGDSVTRHGAADPLILKFQGLHGTKTTVDILVAHIDSLRARYAGPPQKISVNCFFNCNDIEVGDVVRLQLDNLQDYVTGGSIKRAFEVQEVRTNWRTGSVQLSLFGSSQPASESVITVLESYALADSFYISEGTDITGVAGVTANGAGSWVVSSDVSITGNANMTATGAIYYCDGDLEIAPNKTLTISDNIQLRVKGYLLISGKIIGSGNGLPASSTGTAGGVGNTQPPGIVLATVVNEGENYRIVSTALPVVEGLKNEVGLLGIVSTGTDLIGLPTDLRGSSGGTGGDATITGYAQTHYAYGAAGGAGGAGLIIVSRFMSFGVSGALELNGEDGAASSDIAYGFAAGGVISGGGGAGAAGGLLIIADGNGNIDTNGVEQFNGGHTIQYDTGTSTNWLALFTTDIWASYERGIGNTVGYDYVSLRESFTNVKRLVAPSTPAIDSPNETTVASAITLQEVVAANTTLNQTAIEISVSAPIGSGPYISNYKGSHVYARKAATDSWFDIGEVGPVGELVLSVVADGSTWEIKAHAVSIVNVESQDYISDTITVTATLETVIGTGNKIVTDPTPEISGGLVIDTNGVIAYDGTGTPKVTIDANTGTITAVDVDLTGTISADAGAIGGWDINSTSIESPNNRIILDATNNRIQAQSAAGTNYTRIDADGVTGVDSVLGTVFRLPTNGDAPTFSSGIINSTVFNITSAGILETSSTAGNGGAAGQGVRINDTGIRGYKVNDATPVFTLDATDGSMTCTNATVSGAITLLSGSLAAGVLVNGTAASTVVTNASDGASFTSGDAGSLAYLSSVNYADLDGAKPPSNADVTLTAINGGLVVTGGGIALSNGGAIRGGQIAYANGTGFFLGYESAAYKFSIGDTLNYLKWNGSTLDIAGNITIGSTSLTEANTINSNTTPGDIGFTGDLNATYNTTGASVGLGNVVNLNANGMTVSGLESTATIGSGGLVTSGGGSVRSSTKTNYDDNDAGYFLGWDATGTAGYKLNVGSLTSHLKWSAANGLEVQTDDTGTKGIKINPGGDNEIHFYGNGGSGVKELASIGVSASVGTDNVVGLFGDSAASFNRVGVFGQSYATRGVMGYSVLDVGVEGYTISGVTGVYGVNSSSTNADSNGVHGSTVYGIGRGVFGSASGGIGVHGKATTGIGVKAESNLTASTGTAPMQIVPSTNVNEPAHTAPKGSIWVTSGTLRYINNNGSTGWTSF